MNLYAIHPDPKNAPYREWAYENIPELVWEKFGDEPEELELREHVLAKHGGIAYIYARDVLKGPFPAGEAAIVDSHLSYGYYCLLARTSVTDAAMFLARHGLLHTTGTRAIVCNAHGLPLNAF